MKLADIFEQPMQGKVTRVAGDNVEISDPKKPGITTKIDLKKMDIDTKDPNNPTLKPKKPGAQGQGQKIKPGQTISVATETEKKRLSNLEEGINDPAIFKAIFLAGGPGSGKSFMVDAIGLKGLGFRLINNDKAFEFYLEKAGLTKSPEDIMSEPGQSAREKAKSVTKRLMALHLNEKLGLVIDGTGKDFEKITDQANALRQVGYDCAMIFVNTNKETALKRNSNRERVLPDKMVEKMWSEVQDNIGKFHNFFGKNMYVVDNSVGANTAGVVNSMYKRMSQFAKEEPNNPVAKKWIEKARELN